MTTTPEQSDATPTDGAPAARPKVFCVSFQKCGTTSLGLALEVLGYRVGGYRDFRDLARVPGLTMDDVWERATTLLDRYDAFKDTPWPLLYPRLDAAHPGSKFILVIRRPESWIKSVVGDFATHENEIHRAIYGVPYPVGHEQIWLDRYQQHREEVAAYFADRPGDLLTITLEDGDFDWPVICDFLDCPVPETPWPRANTQSDKQRRMRRSRWISKLRRLVGLPETDT